MNNTPLFLTRPNSTDVNDKLISELEVGEAGYTVPWAVEVSPNNDLFINSGYSVQPHKMGTCTVKVERTTDGLCLTFAKWDRLSARHPDWSDAPVFRHNFADFYTS